MHYRMLVTIATERGETSLQARHRVFDLLIEDPSFCGEGGRFGCPVADWFVIGGRWSGCLAQAVMPAAYRDRLAASFPALAGGGYSEADAKPHAHALDALWHEYGGTGPSPFNRSGYEQLGYDDDAVLLTPDLYRACSPATRAKWDAAMPGSASSPTLTTSRSMRALPAANGSLSWIITTNRKGIRP